jgi:DNA-binding MarR family transcriptional regulator
VKRLGTPSVTASTLGVGDPRRPVFPLFRNGSQLIHRRIGHRRDDVVLRGPPPLAQPDQRLEHVHSGVSHDTTQPVGPERTGELVCTPMISTPNIPENPLELERQVCFALAVASRTVIAVYRPILEPLNLTHPQYLVMLALWERSPRTVKDLSNALQLDPGTLSPLLKRLEAIGYVERQRDRNDERALALTLTETGQELRTEALKIPFKVVEQLDMTFEELAQLNEVLRKVIAKATR